MKISRAGWIAALTLAVEATQFVLALFPKHANERSKYTGIVAHFTSDYNNLA